MATTKQESKPLTVEDEIKLKHLYEDYAQRRSNELQQIFNDYLATTPDLTVKRMINTNNPDNIHFETT